VGRFLTCGALRRIAWLSVRNTGEDVWKRDVWFRRVKNVLARAWCHEESPGWARRPDSMPDAFNGCKRGGRINPSVISFRLLFHQSITRLSLLVSAYGQSFPVSLAGHRQQGFKCDVQMVYESRDNLSLLVAPHTEFPEKCLGAQGLRQVDPREGRRISGDDRESKA
jgi:hypothetical protein